MRILRFNLPCVFYLCCMCASFVSCLPSEVQVQNPTPQETSPVPQKPAPTEKNIVKNTDLPKPDSPTQDPSLSPDTPLHCDQVSLANPAATYCFLMGYSSTILESKKGQVGACVLPDGSICDEWEFYSGKCGGRIILTAPRMVME